MIAPTPRVTIFAHVFHLDIWETMCRDIARSIPVPFDLVITGPHPADRFEKPQTQLLRSMHVMVTENRGRDVLPFLKALEAAEPFDIGLKLHTKRSVHHKDGQEWQRATIASLLDGDAPVRILEAFDRDRVIGFVAPSGMLLDLRLRSGVCWEPMQKVLDRLSLPPLSRTERNHRNFIAGTMFWFRRKAMPQLPVADLDNLFEEEAGQTDGTIAHAIERLFSVLGYRKGYTSVPEDILLEVAGQPLEEMEASARKATRHSAPFFLNLPKPVMWVLETFPKQVRVIKYLPPSWRAFMHRVLDRNKV